MRDVVVIGGGLSGLAAAYELERANVDYTLIEVKRLLGGRIRSITDSGFVFDAGPLAIADTLDVRFLTDLGLEGAMDDLATGVKFFKAGTATLTDTLAAQLSGPRLMRMAVSSIGELDNGRYSICLENGVMLDAGALIVAVPARWAQHIFYGYINRITELLLDYCYDNIHRVSLGFRTEDLPAALPKPPNMAHVFQLRTNHPQRTPADHTLIQFGLRLAPGQCTQTDMIAFLCQAFGLPQPVAQFTSYWPEADPLSCYDDAHDIWVNNVRAQLPPGIALIGSDYSDTPPSKQGVHDLQVCIDQGRAAAQQVLATL